MAPRNCRIHHHHHHHHHHHRHRRHHHHHHLRHSIHHTVKPSNRVLFCSAPSLRGWHPTLHNLLPGLFLHINRTSTLCVKLNLSINVIQPYLPQPLQTRIRHNNIWPNQENPWPLNTSRPELHIVQCISPNRPCPLPRQEHLPTSVPILADLRGRSTPLRPVFLRSSPSSFPPGDQFITCLALLSLFILVHSPYFLLLPITVNLECSLGSRDLSPLKGNWLIDWLSNITTSISYLGSLS